MQFPLATFEQALPDGAFCLPMQQGACVSRPFEAVYTARCPIPFEELQKVAEELNKTAASAFPACLRMLPLVLFFSGFILFATGGFLTVGAPGELPPLVVIGFGLCFCGVVSGFFVAAGASKMVTALRQKIGELNGRYRSQNIDFDLHESRHLMHYTNNTYGNHFGDDNFRHSNRRGGLRSTVSYMLVIQNLNQVGDRRVPNVQAMQGYAPGAPVQMPEYQQGFPQQAQPYAQPAQPYQQPYAQAPYQQPAMPPVAAVAQTVTMMTVTCPHNAGPGTTVQIQTPNGGLANVQVPAGVHAGQQFQVQV